MTSSCSFVKENKIRGLDLYEIPPTPHYGMTFKNVCRVTRKLIKQNNNRKQRAGWHMHKKNPTEGQLKFRGLGALTVDALTTRLFFGGISPKSSSLSWLPLGYPI